MEQRSAEWFNARKGRFTASEIGSLMAVKGLGVGADTYCLEKAIEFLYDDDQPSFINSAMLTGIEREPLAFKKFKELKAAEFIEVREATFIPYGEHAGASPDGHVGVDENLEIKCPSMNTFFKLVATGEIDKSHIQQMQMQMLCGNTRRTHYFNYLILNGKEYWHTIVVERDDEMCNLMDARIKEATIIKLAYIEKIKNNVQF